MKYKINYKFFKEMTIYLWYIVISFFRSIFEQALTFDDNDDRKESPYF